MKPKNINGNTSTVGPQSPALFERAQRVIPGGVNSPVRAWKAVGGSPKFITRGHGATILDVEGVPYIDYVGSWGPLILGHAHPRIVAAICETSALGTTFGAPIEAEIELAEEVGRRVPSVKKLRLINSGTEAAMSAVRVARSFTRRTRIVKFDGCYHGHADGMLVRAGSGVATLGLPDSPGVPPALAAETIVVPFNDINGVAAAFRDHPGSIAAVILEPICGNIGVIPPRQGFLEALREITEKHGALLIFDEVITGFRVAPGGAQELYGISPDLTCLGKILGGGLPLAAFGGRAEVMDLLAPEGPVYQAGTLSGNPVAVAAGLTTLRELARPGVYEELENTGRTLQEGLERILRMYGIEGLIHRVGSMWTLFFGVNHVHDAAQARSADGERFRRFFHGMLSRGVYLPPSPFEAAFLSLAHENRDVSRTLQAFEEWAATEPRG